MDHIIIYYGQYEMVLKHYGNEWTIMVGLKRYSEIL